MSDLIQNMFTAIDRRKWDDLGKFFHPNVAYERPGFGQFSGISELKRFYSMIRDVGDGLHRIDKILADNECCVCLGHFIGVRKDATPVDESYVDYFTFEDGLIRYRKTFFYRPAI